MSGYGKSKGSFNYSRQSRYKPYHDRKSNGNSNNDGCFKCGETGHFKSECPNGRKNDMSNGSKSDFGIKKGQQGFSLQKIDWSTVELKDFKRNFYDDIKKECEISVKGVNIDEWRQEASISVLSGYKDIVLNDKKRTGYSEFYNNSWNYDEQMNGNEQENEVAPIIPLPMLTFEAAHFPDFLMNNIKKAGFTKPTPIQSQAWPMALTGCDVIGIAQTGSGKTLAFLFPVIVHILDQPKLQRNDGPISLIIAPTRELAVQIEGEVQKFVRQFSNNKYNSYNAGYKVSNIRYCCVYGGAPRYSQMTKLRSGVEIIIATPGRLLDFIENKVTNLQRTTYLVIDEADRLLDMGFEPQLLAIVNQIRPDRQMMMFSATWPKQVINLAKKFLTKSNNIYQVIIGSKDLNCSHNITQNVIVLESSSQKLDKLKGLINDTLGEDKKSNKKILIFAATKKSVDWLNDILWEDGYYCVPIHGDKTQNMRDRAIKQFKHNEMNILIATDVASRGLHIDDINVVVNFDFPQQIEDYVHRIGRTGRANKSGISYSFMTDDDAPRARELIKILNDNNQTVTKELITLSKSSSKYKKRNGRNNGRGRRNNGYRFQRR